jgi:hypothetical protein
MAGGVDIRDEDHGYADFKSRLKNIRGAVKVGVDDVPHMPTGQPTDEIGLLHEFGRGVPERSFLRAWVDANRLAIQEKLADVGIDYLFTGNAWQVPFGQWAVGEIRKRMWGNIPPPLNPRTARRKNTEIALIDSGQLIMAIIDEWAVT